MTPHRQNLEALEAAYIKTPEFEYAHKQLGYTDISKKMLILAFWCGLNSQPTTHERNISTVSCLQDSQAKTDNHTPSLKRKAEHSF